MSSIPVLIEYLPPNGFAIYEKVAGSAAYVVGEQGQDILMIQKPRRVLVPCFDVSSNPVIDGAATAEEFTRKVAVVAVAQLASALRERIEALLDCAKQAGNEVTQVIVAVRDPVHCLQAPEGRKEGFNIFVHLGLIAFKTDAEIGGDTNPWNPDLVSQVGECHVGLSFEQRALWVEREVARLLGLRPFNGPEVVPLEQEDLTLPVQTLWSPEIVVSRLVPLPTDEQPAPVATDEQPVWEMVIEDMKARDQLGRERYGQPLQVTNGRDAYRDHYEELLDAVVYGKQVMIQRDKLLAENEALKAQVEVLKVENSHLWRCAEAVTP